MINYLFGNIILNISSNPLLFLEIFIVVIMALIFAFPLWVYELHQVEKNWLAADTITKDSESTVTLMRKKYDPSKPFVQDVNYNPTPYGEKCIEDSLESLDLYSEMDIEESDNDRELLMQPLPETKSDIIEAKKGHLQELPYVAQRQVRRSVLEGSLMHKIYDTIRGTFISDYQPLTINLFQTNITEVDVHVGIDSSIPTSLMDIRRPEANHNMKENYISRQFRLFNKDHGDNLEGDIFRMKSQRKESVKNNLNSMPFQLGAVSGLLNNQLFSGQTITENAFSLVKILQNFANTETKFENKMKPPSIAPGHKFASFGTDQPTGYFTNGFFTQMNRNNIGYMHKPRVNRTVPMMQQFNGTTQCEDTKLSSSSPISASYANLGFMCR